MYATWRHEASVRRAQWAREDKLREEERRYRAQEQDVEELKRVGRTHIGS